MWNLTVIKGANHDYADDSLKLCLHLRENKTFHVNPLLGKGFTLNIKPYSILKIKVKNIQVSSAAIMHGSIRVRLSRLPVTRAYQLPY